MTNIRNNINIQALLQLNIISPGIVEDKFGNQATLNPDGKIKLINSINSLSIHNAARLHNFLINNVDKRVDGWRYWYVFIDGEKVKLRRIKDLVHKMYVVDTIEKLLSQI